MAKRCPACHGELVLGMNWYKCNECGAKCCSDCAEDWGIDKDGEQAVICPACMDAMPDKLAANDTEIERLKAIVDKLKKSDDGVPLIPDQQYWIVCHETYAEEDEAFVSHATYCDSETLHEGYGWEWNIPDGDAESYIVLSIWSTREAAEVAKEKT